MEEDWSRGVSNRLLKSLVEEGKRAMFEFVVRMRWLLKLVGSRLEMISVRLETVQSKVTGMQRVIGRFNPGKDDRRTFIVGIIVAMVYCEQVSSRRAGCCLQGTPLKGLLDKVHTPNANDKSVL